MAYHEIKFSNPPNAKKIMGYLENVADGNGSYRACCTLAEFCLSSGKAKGFEKKAFNYYTKAAE